MGKGGILTRGGGCTLCLMGKEISPVVKFMVIWAGIGEGKTFPALGNEGSGRDASGETLSIQHLCSEESACRESSHKYQRALRRFGGFKEKKWQEPSRTLTAVKKFWMLPKWRGRMRPKRLRWT